jgi:hypothetical protein
VRQEALDGTEVQFDPLQHGLWARYARNGEIDHGAWLRACNQAPREHVGTCRHCGGLLRPRHPWQLGQRFDYEAVCLACGHGICAPGGRVLARSGRASERPSKGGQ